MVSDDWLSTLADLAAGPAVEVVRVVIAISPHQRAVERDVRSLGHTVLPRAVLFARPPTEPIDAVLLDPERPDASELIATTRHAFERVPIYLIAPADVATDTLVQAIRSGVTGHFTLPLPIRVLDAWLRWAARRARQPLPEAAHRAPARVPTSEPLRIDMAGRCAWIYDQELSITQGVFELLVVLQRYRNRVVGREWLLRTLFHVSDIQRTRALDARILALRKAIAPLARGGVPRVETVRGVGHQLIV